MYGREVMVTAKIRGIQREYVADPVDEHGRGEPGVINLNSCDGVLQDSFATHDRWLRCPATGSCRLDRADFALSLGCRQTKAIADHGPCHNVPKLRNILVRVVQGCAR
jgi:hypothetical protein